MGGESLELSCLVVVMRPPGRTAEHEIARQAGRAHGLVRRGALIRAGVTRSEIAQRLESGVLLPEYPGIYRVGHRAPSIEASSLAAVWACGEGALLSGRAAAYHWGLIKGNRPKPEVIAPKRREINGLKASKRKLAPPRRHDPPRHPHHHCPTHSSTSPRTSP